MCFEPLITSRSDTGMLVISGSSSLFLLSSSAASFTWSRSEQPKSFSEEAPLSSADASAHTLSGQS